MNNKALWVTKHWGLGIGVVMSVSGLIMAAPGNMMTWKISQGSDKEPFLGTTYTTTAVTRINELIPNKYKLIAIIRDNHDLKGLGTSIMILGTSLLFGCANSLKKEYQRLETANWMIRQSEFKLADLEYTQGVEVDRFAIEMEAQQEISNMQQPPKKYYETENEQPKPEPEFSRSATGFLAWLTKKAEERNTNTFEIKWCRVQSWAGQKYSTEQIISWVEELVNVEQVEWVDTEKKSFRLLND